MRVFSIVLLSMLVTIIVGCSDNPSVGQVQSWLSSVKPGSSGFEAYDVLKDKGFNPHYESLTDIEGSRTTGPSTGVWVSVHLDHQANVTSTDIVPFGK